MSGTRGSESVALFTALSILLVLVWGCGGSVGAVSGDLSFATSSEVAGEMSGGRLVDSERVELRDADWGRYRSRRHTLSMLLPDGKSWRIDDRTTSWVDAKHGSMGLMGSRFRVMTWLVGRPVSQQDCMLDARRVAVDLPQWAAGSVVDEFDSSRMFSDGFSTHVVVGVDSDNSRSGRHRGYVSAVGVSGRRCIVAVFETVVSTADSIALAARLEVGMRVVESVAYESTMPRSGPLE